MPVCASNETRVLELLQHSIGEKGPFFVGGLQTILINFSQFVIWNKENSASLMF